MIGREGPGMTFGRSVAFPDVIREDQHEVVRNGGEMIRAGNSIGRDGFFVCDDLVGGGQLLANVFGDGEHSLMGKAIVGLELLCYSCGDPGVDFLGSEVRGGKVLRCRDEAP